MGKWHSILLILILAVSSCEQTTGRKSHPKALSKADSLTIDLNGISEKDQLAGFAVSVFDKDSVLFQKGFGYADKETIKPYTAQSYQMIASISKTFIGVALMMAVEEGRMSLVDDVNNYLDFDVINPHYPDSIITIKHLATHTSGIGNPEAYNRTYLFSKPLSKDNWPKAWHDYVDGYNENTAVSLSEFLEKTLTPEGEWYEEDTYLEAAPGTQYEYSNLGASLLALAIENAAGKPYKEIVNEKIFAPLEMKNTAWEAKPEEESQGVTYYLENGHHVPPYRIITYPDGGVYSTVEDLTIFCQEMIRCANGEGTLLTKQSFTAMVSPQFDDGDFPDAIFWDLSFAPLVGHSGNDFGTSTLMYFNPQSGTGQILFSNNSIGNEEQEETFYGIFNLLFKYDLKSP